MKRKDLTPKKEEDQTLRKRRQQVQITLSSDEEEPASCNRNLDHEFTDSDENIESYREGLPIYNKRSPSIKEIFKLCLQQDVSQDYFVTVKPNRIKGTATFLVNQEVLNLKHPFDLDCDDTGGSYIKKEHTRFYEGET